MINPKFDLDKSSVKWSDLGQILQPTKKNIKKLKTPGATYDKTKNRKNLQQFFNFLSIIKKKVHGVGRDTSIKKLQL